MATVIHSQKALAVNPLKVSQPMGATLAFLGLARAIPLMHGAQGCTAFGKVFFANHFREPIPLQTTAMDQVASILGADESVVEALRVLCANERPEAIGLLTTGLSETQGADILRNILEFRKSYPEFAEIAIIPANTTDTLGCLETGFAIAVEAMIDTLIPQGLRKPQASRVNLLASSMLTPGDIEALDDWLGAFGLEANFIPDLSDSLSGYLTDDGYASLTFGGAPVSAIASAGEAVATLVIGRSLDRAADLLRARTGVPDYRFKGLLGLADCDALTKVLSEISGRPAPARIERQRAQLLDAMVDCHFKLSAARVAIAADPDLLLSTSAFLTDLGADIAVAVAPARADAFDAIPVESVLIGDLEDMERGAKVTNARLILANSHAAAAATRLGAAHLRIGYPLYDQIGGCAREWIGYRGSRQALFDVANLLWNQRETIKPYRSIYWQGGARANELT
jgi:nitrogenase molybdenum-iron protein NifN